MKSSGAQMGKNLSHKKNGGNQEGSSRRSKLVHGNGDVTKEDALNSCTKRGESTRVTRIKAPMKLIVLLPWGGNKKRWGGYEEHSQGLQLGEKDQLDWG